METSQAMKRLKTQQHEVVSSTGIEDLPREIVFDILSKLSLSSLVRFNSVCKTWRHLLSGNKALLAELSDPRRRRNPCLVFHCDYPIKNQLFFVDLDASAEPSFNRIAVPFCSSLPEYDVVGSCNGLLCLADSLYNESVIIYNPFTREFRELPRTCGSGDRDAEVVFGFGHDPGRNEYKVVKITYHHRSYGGGRQWKRGRSEAQVVTVGRDAAWRSVGRAAHGLRRVPHGGVLVGGALHWATGPRRPRAAGGQGIVSFDVAGERFRNVPGPESSRSRCEWQLFEMRGRLGAALGFPNGTVDVWAMEEDEKGSSRWGLVDVIESYAPRGIKRDAGNVRVLRVAAGRRKCVRVVCVLESGEVVLEYKEKSRALVVYDPSNASFRDFGFKGMPSYWSQTLVHYGSLNPIQALI